MQEDEKAALKEEAERQARLTRQKQEALRQEQEEAENRRVRTQETVRQAIAERSKKERDLREAEERRSLELMERRKLEKERRMEQGKRSEEWRKEKERLAEELAEQQRQARKREDEERRSRIQLVKAGINANSNTRAPLAGWVTLQTNDSLVWKRRFFRLVGTTMFFYRNAKVCVSHDNINWLLREETRTPRYWTRFKFLVVYAL